jgi:hypothetical protein
MPEQVTIVFNDLMFDTVVHHPSALPDDGRPEFIFKDKATVSGAPSCVIAFKARLPSGKVAQCQTVVTAKLLLMVAQAIKGRYGDLGMSDTGIII